MLFGSAMAEWRGGFFDKEIFEGMPIMVAV
jgi:hypothetical protein